MVVVAGSQAEGGLKGRAIDDEANSRQLIPISGTPGPGGAVMELETEIDGAQERVMFPLLPIPYADETGSKKRNRNSPAMMVHILYYSFSD